MRVIFNYGNTMPPSHLQNGIHFTTDAGVMNDENGLSAWSDRGLPA